jgi:glycogen operon protein
VHGDCRFLDGATVRPGGLMDVEWLAESGLPLTPVDWEDPARHRLTTVLASPSGEERIAIVFNGDRRAGVFVVPARQGYRWSIAAGTERDVQRQLDGGALLISGRAVVYLREEVAR